MTRKDKIASVFAGVSMIGFAFSGSVIFMALGVVSASLIMVPERALRRLLHFHVAVDLIGSSLIMAPFIATGAVSGMAVGVFSALVLTLSLFGLRHLLGTEKLSVDGESRVFFMPVALARWVWKKVRGQETAVEWTEGEAPMSTSAIAMPKLGGSYLVPSLYVAAGVLLGIGLVYVGWIIMMIGVLVAAAWLLTQSSVRWSIA